MHNHYHISVCALIYALELLSPTLSGAYSLLGRQWCRSDCVNSLKPQLGFLLSF